MNVNAIQNKPYFVSQSFVRLFIQLNKNIIISSIFQSFTFSFNLICGFVLKNEKNIKIINMFIQYLFVQMNKQIRIGLHWPMNKNSMNE